MDFINNSILLAGVEIGTHYYWEIGDLAIHGQVFIVSWFVITLLVLASYLGIKEFVWVIYIHYVFLGIYIKILGMLIFPSWFHNKFAHLIYFFWLSLRVIAIDDGKSSLPGLLAKIKDTRNVALETTKTVVLRRNFAFNLRFV